MKKRYLVVGFSALLALSVAVPAFGGASDPVATSSGKDKKARKKADKALDAANNAQSTANEALDVANQALSQGGGGGGGSNLQPFTATLGANDTKSLTIGNFTVSSATNNAGNCGAIQLQAGNLDSQRAIGLNAAFANLGPNNTVNITNANVSQAFTGVADNGSSAVSGVVGRAQQGNTCILSGYVTGS